MASSSSNAFSLQRDVGGVPGLHLACEVFSEDAERRLFLSANIWREVVSGTAKRYGDGSVMLDGFPEELFQLINATRDCGLLPEMVTPNSSMHFCYPIGATFASHFDSRHRWGEVVLCVNLGAPCTLRMEPVDKAMRAVSVLLPRRSLYAMTGSSRVDWKHAISKIGPKSVPGLRPPPWNPTGMRRSIVLRPTKMYNMVCLQRMLASCAPGDGARRAALEARIRAQRRFTTEDYNGERVLTPADEVQHVADAERWIAMMELCQPHTARLAAEEATFLGSIDPAVAALYRPGGTPAARPAPSTFEGAGRRLGGGNSSGGGNLGAAGAYALLGGADEVAGALLGMGTSGGGDGDDDTDADLAWAIAASLADAPPASAPARRSSGQADGGAGHSGTGSAKKRAREEKAEEDGIVDLTVDDEGGAGGEEAEGLNLPAAPLVIQSRPVAPAEPSTDELRRLRMQRFGGA